MMEAVYAGRERRFQYGYHDCFLFAISVYDAITGEETLNGFFRQYDDERSAIAFWRNYVGNKSLPLRLLLERVGTQLAGELGGELAPTKYRAMRGALCLVEMPSSRFLYSGGVVIGDRVAVASDPVGLAYYPLDDVHMAWNY